MTQASAFEVLAALALAGLLGMAGQSVRAVGGLKKMSDEAFAQGMRASDLFVPSRLVTSLIVGFVAGMAAAVSIGLGNLMPVRLDNPQILVGLAAAGYAGTDFLEAFARNLARRSGLPDTMSARITKPLPAVIVQGAAVTADGANAAPVAAPASAAKKRRYPHRKAGRPARARRRQ